MRGGNFMPQNTAANRAAPVTMLTMMLIASCESQDRRLAEYAQRATEQQARQNERMAQQSEAVARQSQEVSAASHARKTPGLRSKTRAVLAETCVSPRN